MLLTRTVYMERHDGTPFVASDGISETTDFELNDRIRREFEQLGATEIRIERDIRGSKSTLVYKKERNGP